MKKTKTQKLIAGGKTLSWKERVVRDFHHNWMLYLMMTPVILYYLVFKFGPMFGVSIGSLLGGTAVVEVIFSYPGLGNLAVSAITSSDYNLIQGYVLWLALIYMVINLIVDASYIYIDPRMRLKE